ncbi:MAG TPA: methyltransferase domain-containing protein [Acidimicrobiales bacterium]|jgi:SAM-dependent methyltransferase
MTVHPTAEKGFTDGVGAYERARPGYPPEVVDLLAAELGLGPGRTVVDLGAGTGKLTRLLPPTGARVVAVEPVAAMRDTLARLVPEAEVVDGTAEAMPLEDGSADAVTVAQAFHWFDAPAALAELARVLRPGGGLALLWNTRDESEPWVAELSRLIHWHDSPIPTYDRDRDWPGVVAASGRFTPVEHRRFHHDQEMGADLLVERVLSTSYIAAKPAGERERIAADVRGLVDGFPERFPLPYVTDVYWCRRDG